MKGFNKYILLDNPCYLDYFYHHLKDKYIPITMNDYIKVALEAKEIQCIGIFDYLSLKELEESSRIAFVAADKLITELDKENRQNYKEIFGTDEIKLVSSTMNYLFKRFTIGTTRLLRGLEAIIKNRKVEEIAFMHDGKPYIMCGTKKERGFFYPDDITWNILMNWKCEQKPNLVFIKISKRSNRQIIKIKDPKIRYQNRVRKLKVVLSPFKEKLSKAKKKKQLYAPDKKTLLFLSPLYDLGAALESEKLLKLYNIITWHPDDNSEPSDLNDLSGNVSYFGYQLNFEAKEFNEDLFFDNFNYKKTVIPLIRQYYERKSHDMFKYWNQAHELHHKHKIDMVFWNNSPHRYPAGIVKEFFRLNHIPICGMQHGGMNGSNNLAESIFETDLYHCDYYFSYGFQVDDLDTNTISGEKTHPHIIPIGSSVIKQFSKDYEKSLSRKDKKKVDILFPIALARGEFFFENEVTHTRLFSIQKKIINVMAQHSNKTIILKFPVGSYFRHPLGLYIALTYPGKFIIIDHVSFTESLKNLEADTIVLEELSTPLNEALATNSNIIAYNDPNWYGLTKRAYNLLKKRVIVCNDEELFTQKIQDCLEGRIEKKDIQNKEYFKKYCFFDDPTTKMEKAIIFIVESRAHLKQRVEVHGN